MSQNPYKLKIKEEKINLYILSKKFIETVYVYQK